MKLRQLLKNIQPIYVTKPANDIEVTGLTFDSRTVKPGDLYVAVPGFKEDASRFIPDAQARGAVAVVCRYMHPEAGIPQIVVRDVRSAMSYLARDFYGDPTRDMKVIGVTGTNGKTTTAYLVRHLLNEFDCPAGMIGTVITDVGDGQPVDSERTTPEAIDLFRRFRQMADNGLKAAVMEVSSHALELKRVEALRFDVGIFTNLTQDHLDFHITMDAYRKAKGKLFESLPADGTAVLNVHQLASVQYALNTRGKVLLYSTTRCNGHMIGRTIASDIKGTTFRLLYEREAYVVRWAMVGQYNIENALGAAAACRALGMPLARIASALGRFKGVPGRLEAVAEPSCPFGVFVDYAHTPDAIERATAALRAVNPKRIITLFGCGGDRDKTKRPLMARAAENGSDVVVVTSDNPRSEDPQAIINDVLPGFENRNSVIIEPDRAAAIRQAIALAEPGDVVLLAGKGHETYQIFADRTDAFDDRAVARDILAA